MQYRTSLATMKHFFVSLTVLLSVHILYTAAELTEFLWSRGEVSGVYKNEDGSLGIKFVCRQGYLDIKTLDDITVVYFSSYREVDKRMARSVYVLDEEYLQHKDSNAHGHLDRPVGNTTKSFNDTLNDLLHLEEMTLLENATRAVGEEGVTGRNTPIVLPFYIFALKVTELLDITLYNATTNELSEHTSSPVYTPPPRQKRIFGWVARWFSGSSNDCDKYKKYKDCKGLCGRKCDCWRWVCGDCCWHRKCYDHDVCCEKHGYFSWSCLAAPDVLLGLWCDRPYHC